MSDTIRWVIDERVGAKWQALTHFPGALAATPDDAFARVRALIPRPLGTLRAKQCVSGNTSPVEWIAGVNAGQAVTA